MLALSKTAYIIAESRKLGFEANYRFAGFENVSGIITESKPPEKILKIAEERGVEFILPD